MDFELFKQKLTAELFAVNQEDTKLLLDKKKLTKTQNLEQLLAILAELGYPDNVSVVADSPVCHELILANPDAFIKVFSRDSIKAIIHMASIHGNLPLVQCLIEQIKLDVVNETVANPLTNARSSNGEGSEIPVLHAGIKSKSLPLTQYLLSFYEPSQFSHELMEGPIQTAMCLAAEQQFIGLVSELLSRGVNAQAKKKEGYYSKTTAVQFAVRSEKLPLVQLLVEAGAAIDPGCKRSAISRGYLPILEYFKSKDIAFNDNSGIDSYILLALGSRSVPMARYVLRTLQLSPYPQEDIDEEGKKHYYKQILKRVMESGSLEMLHFIEQEELKVPVAQLIKKELETTPNYHQRGASRSIILEAVCSYSVTLLKGLFETRGLMPSQAQLNQLLGYAYDCGRYMPQHQKFATHAYVYSLTHSNPLMRPLLRRVSEAKDLSTLSRDELFILFADYTKKYPSHHKRPEYDIVLRENSVHLAQEIAKRKIPLLDLVTLAKENNGALTKDILFYLLACGQGYAQHEIELLFNAGIFDLNADLHDGQRPLHLVYQYQRTDLITSLMQNGADADFKNARGQTPLLLTGDCKSENFKSMLTHTQNVDNTLTQAMQIRGTEVLEPILQQIHGKLSKEQALKLLAEGAAQPVNVYTLLCLLADETYKQVKAHIRTTPNAHLDELLTYADEFRRTKVIPKVMRELQQVEQNDAQRVGYAQEMRGACHGAPLSALLFFGKLSKSPYPEFLKEAKLKPHKLTAQKVAHSLWLKDKSHYGTEVAKAAFGFWAANVQLPRGKSSKDKLSFGMQEVEDSLTKYTMK